MVTELGKKLCTYVIARHGNTRLLFVSSTLSMSHLGRCAGLLEIEILATYPAFNHPTATSAPLKKINQGESWHPCLATSVRSKSNYKEDIASQLTCY